MSKSFSEESSAIRFANPSAELPGATAVKDTCASTPSPDAPGIAVESVSKIRLTVPAALSIVPPSKNAGRKEEESRPRSPDCALSTPADQERSNWNAYKSNTSLAITSTVNESPGLA